ncbi:hypothetical protein VE02_03494 [Pseudogymnoascus sp. 03VT05]|nr:hypothetical protein VE02_03494 [Pseudogymnoascus sp. 03VT05]
MNKKRPQTELELIRPAHLKDCDEGRPTTWLDLRYGLDNVSSGRPTLPQLQGFQNDGADVLSCDYFQGYSNIKQSIQYNPENLLVTQGIATGALTLPESAAKGSARVRAIQQRLLRRMQGSTTPDDPDASRPLARERQRIQHAVAETEFAFRMEQVISLDVARLTPSRRNLRTILRPIFQLMRFYLQETSHYTHLLRCFQPTVFPQILGSFARVFELGLDEMLRRFQAQAS